MALPSQTERTHETSRPIMTRSRGRRGPSKRIVGVVALLAIAGGVWALYSALGDGTGPAQANAEPAPAPKSAPPPPRSIAPDIDSNVPATPTGPSPMVLTQGRSGGTTTPATASAAPASSAPAPTSAAEPDPTKPRPVDVTSPQPPATSPNPGTLASTPTTPVPQVMTSSAAGPRAHIEAGDAAMRSNNLVQARVSYSRALMHPETSPGDQEALRSKLTAINEDLLFSPKVAPGDPLVETYTVVAGDSLERIRRKRDLAVDHRLIARVNRLANPNSIRVGQKLKLVRGPFHAVVHKSSYRMDLFAGSPDDQSSWIYIRSFPVGLGENDGTPLGTFVIKRGSKLINPHWVNPRTGERFDADDPKNPIGEYWLGWEGVGDSRVHTGFGIHGTIDPSSIGQSKSMGCVRLANDDVALVYELLVEAVSVVQVVPN
jgi:hypothetical protein